MTTSDNQQALERAVLAGIVHDVQGRHEALAQAQPGDFRSGRHRAIFTALSRVVADDIEPDAMAVTDVLERGGDLEASGGIEYVEEILETRVKDVPRITRRLVEGSRRRRLARVGEQIAVRAADRSVGLDEIVGDSVDRLIDAGTTDDGIITARDVREGVEDLMVNGLPKGWEPGWPSLDRLYRPAAGYWTAVTGIPSHGKSTFLDCLLVNLAVKHGHHFVLFSPENFPVRRHAAALVQSVKSRPIDKMDRAEVMDALDWVHEHFTWIDPNETTTLRGIIARAQAIAARRRVNGLVIDPWNEVEHRRPEGIEETDYISSALTFIRRAARTMNIHVWVVAHPKKLEKKKDGTYPVPQLYDVSGSANWYNKADCGITAYRDKESDPLRTQIFIRKVRFEEHGQEGEGILLFDPEKRMFRSPGAKGIDLS